MATTGDPWRTLGLAPGASLDEVRRAYRRLAKANHPDAAGEAALPRFLAIQAAYEAIAGPGRGRRVAGRPGAAHPAPPPAEPWRADPDRARASGRADGRRPGARPTGRPAGPAAAGDAGPSGSGRTSGAGAEPGATRGRTGSTGRARRSSRGPKTAGPYDTSYDAADEEPFEPGWSGATWYGASSGTYWTINPKEYADPRKHGPEYQARARRSRKGWILDDEPEPPVDSDAAPEQATAGAAGAAGAAPDGPEAGPARPSRPSRDLGRRPTAWSSRAWSSTTAGDAAPPPAAGPGTGTPTDDADPARFRGPLLPRPATPAGRLAIALLGWPPLALFVAATIGESTGCGRYAASCGELSSPGTWIVSVAILLLLLAAPAVAAWSAHGTIAALVIGVPSAVILSAAGGTNVRESSGPILIGFLALAYLAGVGYAVVAPRVAAATRTPGTGSLR